MNSTSSILQPSNVDSRKLELQPYVCFVDIHYSHTSPTQLSHVDEEQLKCTTMRNFFSYVGQVSRDKGQLPRTYMLVVIESML